MITAWDGPLIGFGAASSFDANSARSPSMWDQGCGIMDPRAPFCYQPGANTGSIQGQRGAYGWWGVSRICLVDQVPSTLSLTNIAAAAVPVAGTAMTLVSTSGGGITVSTSITRADTGATVTGLLAIDTAMAPVQNAAAGGNLFWDPTKAIARNVRIDSAGDDSGATFTVAGYDVYGYPMTETITGVNTATASGAKAFKYIASVTPAGTLSGSNASVGTGDVIGFMMRADRFQYVQIYWPDTTLIASSTGFTAAVTTDPATATTGDVRGTYALQGSASNNARRLIILAMPQLANIGTATGLCGVTQA